MYGPPIPGLPAESCPFAALPWAPGGPSLAAGSQVVKDHPPAGQAARPADLPGPCKRLTGQESCARIESL